MRYAAYGFVATVALVPCLVFAAAPVSEISIKPDGTFSATNVTVMQKSGANLFSRVTWGSVFLRLTVLTTPAGVSAIITKNNGGAAVVDDIQVGDVLAVKGTLAPGADNLLINATTIRDLSLNKEPKTFSGTVKSVDYSGSFVLSDLSADKAGKKLGLVKVVVDGNTTITKGVRAISLGEVVAGDKVLSVSGTYDFDAKTLSAASVTVYQDKTVFNPRNFEGKLKSIDGATLPAVAVITVGGSDYTVYLAATASIASKNKTATTLQRYTIGDLVRFYGAIHPTNLQEIDANQIRNLSF